jgi:glycine cleavage system H protein
MELLGKKNCYFTRDHEWIDFQGTVAYTGICLFKLTGFKEIDKIVFPSKPGFFKKGDVLAVIRYHDYKVEAHMPVDGKVIQFNEKLMSDDRNYLLKEAERNGWIAFIVPLLPYERSDLLLPKQYQLNGKSKYAK